MELNQIQTTTNLSRIHILNSLLLNSRDVDRILNLESENTTIIYF